MTYPEPVCMNCGRVCYITEEVDTAYGGPVELWNYCPHCRVETFHKIPVDQAKETKER